MNEESCRLILLWFSEKEMELADKNLDMTPLLALVPVLRFFDSDTIYTNRPCAIRGSNQLSASRFPVTFSSDKLLVRFWRPQLFFFFS